MKEATGELNATVVIIVLIAALSAFFFMLIWPMLKNNMVINYKCSDAVCEGNVQNGRWQKCTYYKLDGDDFEGLSKHSDPTAHSVNGELLPAYTCPYQG